MKLNMPTDGMQVGDSITIAPHGPARLTEVSPYIEPSAEKPAKIKYVFLVKLAGDKRDRKIAVYRACVVRGKDIVPLDSLDREHMTNALGSDIRARIESDELRAVSPSTVLPDVWYVSAVNRQTAIDRVAMHTRRAKNSLTAEKLSSLMIASGGIAVRRWRVTA